MGIINVTPDSFSDGGLYDDPRVALHHARELLAAGALLLDVGGESTRPGAAAVTVHEELDRVLPVIKGLRDDTGAVISIDTSKPEVAERALAAGTHLVNDVTGLGNPEMLTLCARAGAPAVIMHMQGEPGTMQLDPRYRDVVAEVRSFLTARARAALQAGVPDVMIDPGIGFGKTLAHNLALLRSLPELVATGYPVLVGGSRKRLIEALAGDSAPAERDPGSLALHLFAAAKGVAMVRAHRVGMHRQALAVWGALHG